MPCLCVFRGLSIAYKNLGYANLYNVPHTTLMVERNGKKVTTPILSTPFGTC